MAEVTEQQIFDALSKAIEDIDGDMDATDLISVLMRIGGIVVSHAPDIETRGNIIQMAIHCFHLYVAEAVSMEGGMLSKEEMRNQQIAKQFFTDETEGETLQ